MRRHPIQQFMWLLVGLALANTQLPSALGAEEEVCDASLLQHPSRYDRGEAGEVSYIYTIGSPGTAAKPFPNNMRRDKCFPGLRVFTVSREERHDCSDVVAQLSNAIPFWHARMTAVPLLDPTKRWPVRDPPQVLACTRQAALKPVTLSNCRFEPCKARLIAQPTSNPKACPVFPPPYLHVPEITYIPWTNNSKTGMLDRFPDSLMYTQFANDVAYARSTRKVTRMLWGYGYRAVGRATAPDVLLPVFPWLQVSWLLQNEQLDCVLTFKGTDRIRDIVDDANTNKTTFCGWPGVHAGFAAHLRVIVGSKKSNFATEVKDKLPRCKSLAVVGHSLGAALVELFSYCANRGKRGLAGESLQDWQRISWRKGVPARIPSLPWRR